MENLLSRKFLFAVLVVILEFVLVAMGKIDEAEKFANFAMVIGGLYIIGNLGSNMVNTVKSIYQPTTTITTTQTPDKTITVGQLQTSNAG